MLGLPGYKYTGMSTTPVVQHPLPQHSQRLLMRSRKVSDTHNSLPVWLNYLTILQWWGWLKIHWEKLQLTIPLAFRSSQLTTEEIHQRFFLLKGANSDVRKAIEQFGWGKKPNSCSYRFLHRDRFCKSTWCQYLTNTLSLVIIIWLSVK